jgi:hypothetical protein
MEANPYPLSHWRLYIYTISMREGCGGERKSKIFYQ